MKPGATETTLRAADIEGWNEPGTHLAVLGDPVRHSLSPAMHNAALAQMAATDPRLARWRYWRIETPAGMLRSTIGLLHGKGFAGLNLTIPHKQAAAAMVVHIDAEAAAAGAVNTLRRTAAGYEGFNTDGHGIIAGLRESLGVEIAGADVVLLGAGGAARAAALAFLRRGCRSLWIGNRSERPLAALVAALGPFAAGADVRGFAIGDPPRGLPVDAVIVNATSLGLAPGDPPAVDLARFPGAPVVFDMIYKPAETPLTGAAARLGLRAASGLSMLVHQGARSLELWTGTEPPVEVMAEEASAALRAR